MTENKRFEKAKFGTVIKDNSKQDTLWTATECIDRMNELYEENQSTKKHIRELYRIVKIDVDNEIEVYPKVMLEYLINILKIIGDVE